MAKLKLNHARHDPTHCLAPGLFRSLKRGERKRGKLDVVYDYGNGKRIEFSGPEPLGVDDLRILQGLVAMAAMGDTLSSEPQTEAGRQLRLFMKPTGEAVKLNAIVVRGSYRALCKEIGYANIEDTKPIRACIERLFKVSIIVQNEEKKRQGFRLLSEYVSDTTYGKLYVALNPMIASAVIGSGQYVRIDMDEVRKLTSDQARLIHQRLCGWINPGNSGRVAIGTLCSYVWPNEGNAETMKKRRQTARKALTELVSLDWDLIEYVKDKWRIKRPKPPR